MIKGKSYEKDDFADVVYGQFNDNTGIPVDQLEDDDREKLDQGVDAFWDSFTAVGAEAKVFSHSNDIPEDIRDAIEKDMGRDESGVSVVSGSEAAEDVGADAVAEGNKAAHGTGASSNVIADEVMHASATTESSEEEEEPECACDSITADILVYHHFKGDSIADYSGSVTLTEKESSQDISVDKDETTGKDTITIEIDNIKVICRCTEGGEECEVYAKKVITKNGDTKFLYEDEAYVDSEEEPTAM